MIIEELRKCLKTELTSSQRVINGLWSVECLCKPTMQERLFNCNFYVAKTIGQGSAYSQEPSLKHEVLASFVGQDALDIDCEDIALKICLYDSLAYSLNIGKRRPNRTFSISCDSASKLRWRTEIIYNTAQNIMRGKKDFKMVNVGTVRDILQYFSEQGIECCGTDFDKAIVGTTDGIVVFDGNETLSKVAEADIAIVTGMTLTTDTIDDIISVCAKERTKLIVYAETGTNLGPYFVDKGVDAFISEPFPFYIFDGYSKINIYEHR